MIIYLNIYLKSYLLIYSVFNLLYLLTFQILSTNTKQIPYLLECMQCSCLRL